MGEWQPIETAPRDGTNVLVYDGFDISVATWADREWLGVADGRLAISAQTDFGTHYMDIWPTHWMPLPSPPALKADPERGD